MFLLVLDTSNPSLVGKAHPDAFFYDPFLNVNFTSIDGFHMSHLQYFAKCIYYVFLAFDIFYFKVNFTNQGSPLFLSYIQIGLVKEVPQPSMI